VHELVANVVHTFVGAEVHDQSAHRSVGLARSSPGERINIRKQAIAQSVVADQDLLRFGSVRPKLVLVCCARAVRTEDWIERAERKPTNIKSTISGILRIRGDEAADVGGPVGKSRHRIVEARGNLLLEKSPSGIDVP